jgi:hypothetical protein
MFLQSEEILLYNVVFRLTSALCIQILRLLDQEALIPKELSNSACALSVPESIYFIRLTLFQPTNILSSSAT